MLDLAEIRHVGRRLRRAVRRHGLRGTARLAARADEVSTWFEVALDDGRPRIALNEGLLVLATEDEHFARFNAIGTQNAATARQRLAAGGRPWLVLIDEQPVFGCWLFAGRTPINSMPGEWLALPDGVHCLEDSVTAPGFRGRGLAPGAWSALFDQLQGEGATSVITNVANSNVPSTRAVLKAGFKPAASMRYVRLGPCSRQHVRALAGDSGPAIARGLDGRMYVMGWDRLAPDETWREEGESPHRCRQGLSSGRSRTRTRDLFLIRESRVSYRVHRRASFRSGTRNPRDRRDLPSRADPAHIRPTSGPSNKR